MLEIAYYHSRNYISCKMSEKKQEEIEEHYPVGEEVYFWVWLNINEGDLYKGIVESVVGDHSIVNSNGTRYRIANSKMFKFIE